MQTRNNNNNNNLPFYIRGYVKNTSWQLRPEKITRKLLIINAIIKTDFSDFRIFFGRFRSILRPVNIDSYLWRLQRRSFRCQMPAGAWRLSATFVFSYQTVDISSVDLFQLLVTPGTPWIHVMTGLCVLAQWPYNHQHACAPPSNTNYTQSHATRTIQQCEATDTIQRQRQYNVLSVSI